MSDSYQPTNKWAQLTHEEVQDSHIYEIHQSGSLIVRRCLLHCITVSWVFFPPGNKRTETLRQTKENRSWPPC